MHAGQDLHRNVVTLGLAFGKPAPVFRVAAPNTNAADFSGKKHGFKVGPRLSTGAKDGKIPRILAGKQSGRHSGHGGRADRSDFSGIHYSERLTMLCLKDHDRSHVRIIFGAVVARENTHDLQSHDLKVLHIGGHHAQGTHLLWKPHNRSQGQDGLSPGKGFQGFGHDLDTFGHRKELPYFGLVNDEDLHGKIS
jgi:hypothetical protein